jgi:hypothetical protein
VTCALILCSILVAGLWPFHQPANDVSWLSSGNGLVFGQYGVVISSATLTTARSAAEAPCTIEVWLQSTETRNASTILVFYTPETPRQFGLGRWETGLVLESNIHNALGGRSDQRAFVADAFRDGKSVFVSITSDGHESTVYLDGAAVKPNRDFAFSAKDLTGRLVIGTSPETSDSWSGRLLGLAVYRRNLAPAEVLQDYEVWTKHKSPRVAHDESPVAVYRFDEHRGNVVHNLVPEGPDLYISRVFSLLDQPMLQSPSAGFKWSPGYWVDVTTNIAGFVPLGFCLYAYLRGRRSKAPMVTSVLVGAATSLTIECLQAYLPTRNSGINDLLTNTLGTYLGAGLYRVLPESLRFGRRLA